MTTRTCHSERSEESAFRLNPMPTKTIDQLIINSPYEEPREYWKRDSESKLFSRVPGRRPAGYIPYHRGPSARHCSKMATGSGKTIITAMLIAWQILNKVSYPQDKRFSKNIFVVAPGLTVTSRLQVLKPSNEKNFYVEFSLIPLG